MDETKTHTVSVDEQSRLAEPPCSTPVANHPERSVLALLHDSPHGMELIVELPCSKYIKPNCQRVEHLIRLGVPEDRALQVVGLTTAQYTEWMMFSQHKQIADQEKMLRHYRHRAEIDLQTIAQLHKLLAASTSFETDDG